MFMIILKSLSKLNWNIKQILLFFIFVLTSLCSFAQRVNEHGLKMVSEIEYQPAHCSRVELIKFRYDDHNRLIRMSVYYKWIYTEADIEGMKSWTPQERKEHLKEFPTEPKLYRDFIRTSDGLTVKDYGTYNYSPLRWETAFDCYGNISNIAVFEEFEPGAIVKNDYNFFYERDGIGNIFRLSRYNHTETSKRRGQKSWYGTTVGTTYRELFFKDGFLITAFPSDFEKYRELIDYAHENDTNINLLPFFCTNANIYGGGMNMDWFVLTEWLPCRSKYFMLDTDIMKVGNRYESFIVDMCRYGYDGNGNLTEIETISEHNKKYVRIKYLY
jgi:hypothetical protein